MIKKLLCICILIVSCNEKQKEEVSVIETEKDTLKVQIPHLDLHAATNLSKLPLKCIVQEYPNKLNQTIGGDEDLKSPQALHPAFYGCFDWHSAVHGHWSLVSLLKQFPDIENKSEIGALLLQNISKENIQQEIDYFDGPLNSSYERTYGWAWLLKLAEELHTWDNPLAKQLEENLMPLTDLMVEKYIEFLPKLNYPIRVGEHPNTVFGLSFAYDYAKTVGDEKLLNVITQRAKDFYLDDQGCPIGWEPGGFDFLSPCLEEAALMKRILSKPEFEKWFSEFLPPLLNPNFQLEVGIVSDRSDGKLVHLDGVNFSRAWSLLKIAEGMPQLAHLQQIAYKHINYSLPNIVDDAYEGGHWLGSFALYAINSVPNE
ncbi:DUF2891 domain-containing protein [Aegicerativicinus sediminis]